VTEEELGSTGALGWILGHIHKPYLTEKGEVFILNPGTPQPLNPKDQGRREVWEVTIHSNWRFEIESYPLANLGYLSLEVDVADLERIEKLTSLISRQLEERLSSQENLAWQPELIISRLKLTGRTQLSREIERQRQQLVQELELKVAGSRVIIEKLINETQAPIDIESLAEGNSVLALVASYLVDLKEGRKDQLPADLVATVQEKLYDA
jgi:DNA repair exonuclease SbcCD nuclease subunit